MNRHNAKDEGCKDINEESQGKNDDERKPTERHTGGKTTEGQKRCSVLRSFFGLTGGSIFYCLSALSIIYGIVQIIGPVLAKSNKVNETLPCIGALNLYELALLGVLALIVVWRNVTDDAIFLVVLAALFLIVSGMTIDTIASNNPRLVFLVGLASLIIAAVKLWIMKRYISLRLERFLLVGVVAILAWNFLISPIMAFIADRALDSVAAFHKVWLIGWLTMLAGGILMLLHATGAATAGARRHDKNTPFLRTQGMGWVFAAILLLAANVHQYALISAFDMQFNFGDFAPAITLAALLTLELMRNYGKRFGAVEIIAALSPLAAIFFVILSGSFAEGPSLGLELLWYPPVLLGVTAIAILWLSVRNRRRELLYVALAYTLGIVLTAGITPSKPTTFNWEIFNCAALLLFLIGIILQDVFLTMAAVFALAVGVSQSDLARALTSAHDLPISGIVELLAGFCTMTAYVVFVRKLPREIALLGAGALCVGAVVCFGRAEIPSLISGMVIVCFGGVVWLRTRDVPVTVILCVPLVHGIYINLQNLKEAAHDGVDGLKDMKGWPFVILSFVLLAAGALISLWKGGKRKGPDVQLSNPQR